MVYINIIMLRARAYTWFFPEKICQSATDVLYRVEVQTDMRVADLLQIVENVADCGDSVWAQVHFLSGIIQLHVSPLEKFRCLLLLLQSET